ncbi:MFS transporter [Patulibacter medicamentivorans]|jgi:CP family cyanate transporter-like MFS transporter|uniref:MFS transporter n=1 Tax=Patulibacter medicamentivorans TaxID=1097667 RepID=H0E638_9ACTN|nr:MFS transporter [Patulibacter medicamentivorans]EHN10867.1 MFS transporter [Patulibacter medicamentivorans]
MTRARTTLLLVGIVLITVNLRPAIVAVSPLLDGIREQTGMSGATAGLLTTLPVLCFGALAPLAPRLSRRLGPEAVVVAAMLLLLAGILVRLSSSLAVLFAGTVLIGGAIAVANVLLPSMIKRDLGHATGMAMGVYAMALSAGGALAAAITVPLQDGIGSGWRTTLALWALLAVPAVLAAGGWLLLRRRQGGGRRAAAADVRAARSRAAISLWRDPVAWQVTLFMGLQSLQFYAAAAWLPTIFADHGFSESRAGLMLALATIVGTLSSLVMPILAGRALDQRRLVVTTIALYALGTVGLLAAPTAAGPLWMALIGFAQGAGISLALTMIVLRSPDPEHAAALSGMAQTVGYLLAATGPFALGALHDASGGWTVPLLVLLVLLVPLLLSGLGAGRRRTVGTAPVAERVGAAAVSTT